MKRIWIHKRNGFDVTSPALTSLIQSQLQIEAVADHYIGYDVADLDPKIMPAALSRVFSEAMCDDILESLNSDHKTLIVKEPLPGQYDQRSDAAEQCLRLLDPNTQAKVSSFEAVLFDRTLSAEERSRFIRYWINPIEMREKSLTHDLILDTQESTEGEISGFTSLDPEQVKHFLKINKAAMSPADLKLIQDFFRTHEHRQPTMTEFKVLDTYWSDHCRHTTFETRLSSITIPKGPYEKELNAALDLFYSYRQRCQRTHKPVTLMEMATIGGRVLDDPRVNTVKRSMPVPSKSKST